MDKAKETLKGLPIFKYLFYASVIIAIISSFSFGYEKIIKSESNESDKYYEEQLIREQEEKKEEELNKFKKEQFSLRNELEKEMEKERLKELERIRNSDY